MIRENEIKANGKADMIWNRPLRISEESQEKLQAAYDQVLAGCAARYAEKSGMRRRRPFRRLAAVSLAAVMLMGAGIVATAAMGYFSRQVKEQDGNIVYEFTLDYALQPVEVSAMPGYLPDGLETGDSGQFRNREDDSRAISIIPYTMLNIDMMKSQMNFPSTAKVEHTTIQNMDADILTAIDDQKYQRGKNILLFNPTDGYVIQLWGNYGISMEELKKVAENLDITVVRDSSLSYSQNDEAREKESAAEAAEQERYSQFIENGVKAEDITALGQMLDCPCSGTGFRIDKVDIYDSLYDVPGYTDKGVYSMEELTPWLNSDGTHKPYLRSCYGKDGNIIREEYVQPKFMAVEITASQYGENTLGAVALDATLVHMKKPTDSAYLWPEESSGPVPSENYELQMDNRCFYLNQPENLQGEERSHSFFYRNLKAGDAITYTIIFAVDEDILTDESSELFLQFNASGGDAYMTDYCALQ